jgi:hypothetical protein
MNRIGLTPHNLTGVFHGLNDPSTSEDEMKKFEYVIVVLFDNNFKLKKILEIPWDLFLQHKRWHKTMRAWNLSITRNLIEEANKIF